MLNNDSCLQNKNLLLTCIKNMTAMMEIVVEKQLFKNKNISNKASSILYYSDPLSFSLIIWDVCSALANCLLTLHDLELMILDLLLLAHMFLNFFVNTIDYNIIMNYII